MGQRDASGVSRDGSTTSHDASLHRDTSPDVATPDALADASALSPASPVAWADRIVYVLMPSAFSDGDPSNDYMKDAYNLPNPEYSGGYLGGDFAGLLAHVGYLKALGVNTVLLYPVMANGCRSHFVAQFHTVA
jgi:hypothetical protein